MSDNDIGGEIGDVDLSTVEQKGNFEPLPVGWYPAEIEEAVVKKTKAGTGSYLSLKMVVMVEPYIGRKLFSNINLKNPSQVCVDIGRQELAALASSIGIKSLSDSSVLIGQQLQVKVKISKDNRDGDAKNEVGGYKALVGSATVVSVQASESKPAVASASKAPIWLQKKS